MHVTSRRILVVGAGFLGSAIALALNQSGHRVTLLSPRAEASSVPGNPAVVRGRQEDGALMNDLLRVHSVVIHAAWSTTPGSSAGRPALESAAGLAPWLAFLETLRRYPTVRLLFLSSGGTVYGNPDRLPVSEDAPLQPRSCHGAGKASAELFLSTLRPDREQETVVLRVSNVYGPGQPWRDGFGVLRHLLQCATNGKPFTRWGDGSQVRDYLYIDDFVDAVLRMVDHPKVSGVYNVGSGSGASVQELITLFESVTARPVRIESQPARNGDVDRIVLDSSKIRRAVGWAPAIGLREGIALTWRWLNTTS